MILKTTLFDYQRVGVDKLIQLKIGALYMEMGMGKTRTALEIIERRLAASRIDRVLWLCPYAIQREIAADIDKHAADWRDAIEIHGIESMSTSVKLNQQLDQLVKEQRVMLVVDESSLIKNNRALRTRHIQWIAEQCPYRLILNGTPISRNETDLFAQWYLLDWRILGYRSYWSFSQNHIEYDPEIKGRVRRCLNIDYLTEKIAPYTFQVLKKDHLTLPGKSYDTGSFCLTDEQEEHYWEVVEAYLPSESEEDVSAYVYRMFTAAMHVTSGRRVDLRDRDSQMRTAPFFADKYDNPRLQRLLREVRDCADKYIIWCHYTHEVLDVCEALREQFGESAVVARYGDMPQRDRDAALHKFRGAAQFLVGNKACSAHGLNLQHCHRVIYYSNDWDWATRIQSEDRVHRIGQEHNIEIMDIMASDTIDERIQRSLMRKENLADTFKCELGASVRDQRGRIMEMMGGVRDDVGEGIHGQKCL